MDSNGEESFWTDEFRLESAHTLASVVWYDRDWMTHKTYLNTSKEVFNEELYPIGKILDIALKKGQVVREAGKQQAEQS